MNLNISSPQQKRLLRRGIILVVLVVFFFFLVMPFLMQRTQQKNWQCVDDQITVEITRANGRLEYYHNNLFAATNRGDHVRATLPLPLEQKVNNAALCLNIYHTTVTVLYGDELVYSYGLDAAEQGRFIGNTLHLVPLRNDMWGGEITLELLATENNGCSGIVNAQIIPQVNSMQYFYVQYQSMIPIMFACIVLSILALALLLLFGKTALRMQGIYLSLFTLLVPFWYLASRGFFFTTSPSIPMAAHGEYICLLLIPIPFCLYMYSLAKFSRFQRVFSLSATALFSLCFVVATVLNYTTTIHYSAFLLPLQLAMLVCIVFFFFFIFRRARNNNRPTRVILYGTGLALFTLIWEILRLNVSKFVVSPLSSPDFSLTPLAIVVLIGTLALSYIMQLLELRSAETDRAVLRRLAYVDVLTGLSNRAYCQEQMVKMEQSGETNYALLFFDCNGLKEANDKHGHDMGDRYLQCVAHVLKDVFGSQRFCARWGGDEFVVCVTGRNVYFVENMLYDFELQLRHINNSGQFPFPVSVAYGMARNTDTSFISMSDALQEADRRMYVKKSARSS